MSKHQEQIIAAARGKLGEEIVSAAWEKPRHILSNINLPTHTRHNRRVLAVLTYLRQDGKASIN